jgi:NAD(P)-dependent dehydrogenase (short-subunit alcohol dehydrogenase family)
VTTSNHAIYLVVGASSGIGRSLALALARERKRVGLVGRNEERLRRVAQEVVMFGGEPFVAVSDVREPVSIQAALAQIAMRGWTIDTVFLSSGIAESVDLQNFGADAFDEIIQTNVMGVANWLEALQPLLKAQRGGGTVAVLSSLSADRALPGGGAGYSASKAAVSQLLDGLRAPWARQGIRLVTVAPGFVKTPMIAGIPQAPLAMEPEDAAQTILDGLRHRQSVIRFPRLASLTMSLLRQLPPALLDKLARD